MKPVKLIMAAAAVTVYFAFPPYRYYVIGTWVAYKILNDKPRPPRVIRKGSKQYLKITGQGDGQNA
jgi:hypothetical protein